MEPQRWADYHVYQMNALKALCPYLEDAAAPPLAPHTTRTQPADRATAPADGVRGRSMSEFINEPSLCDAHLLSNFCENYASNPSAPVLNTLKVAEGLERKRRPGRPPSSKANRTSSGQPPSHCGRPVKASISV